VTVVLLAAGFAAVLGGALLFTNAVEWAGNRLGLGVGAVGTVLAAVSTALPESVIPVVAILRGEPDADEVAVGAIVGAPFMLATIAMALMGYAALAYSRRRPRFSPVVIGVWSRCSRPSSPSSWASAERKPRRSGRCACLHVSLHPRTRPFQATSGRSR
jgi:Sodium/calcium exchanger protein